MQREIAFNYDLVAQHLSAYKDLIKVYSYDVNANAFPKGIVYSTAPPEDIEGKLLG